MGSIAEVECGLRWDEALQAWMVESAGLAETVLAHPGLSAPPYGELYRMLGEHFGVAFDNLRFAYSHIPLCLHAAEHAKARRGIAGHLATRRGSIDADASAVVARHFNALKQPGTIDLMQAVIEPFVIDLLSVVTGLDDIGADQAPTASQIFGRGVGMARRRRMEAEMGRLRRHIADTLGQDPGSDDVGRSMALLILGRDALTGTLGTSLFALLKDAGPVPLAAIAFPEMMPDTGVPYTERFVVEPVEIAGRTFEVGQKFRVFLGPFTQTGEARDRAKIFGVGAHTCLGRPLSLDIWRGIGRIFAETTTRVEIVDYALRDDEVFAYPIRFLARIDL
jgi:cytochrome P450